VTLSETLPRPPVSDHMRRVLAVAQHPSAHAGSEAVYALGPRCKSPRQELNLITKNLWAVGAVSLAAHQQPLEDPCARPENLPENSGAVQTAPYNAGRWYESECHREAQAADDRTRAAAFWCLLVSNQKRCALAIPRHPLAHVGSEAV